MDKTTYLQVPGRQPCVDGRLRCNNSSNNGCQWRADDHSNDKYTAAIELSNKCREFYKSRLEAANSMKSRWTKPTSDSDPTSSSSSFCSTSSSSSSSLSSSQSQLTSSSSSPSSLTTPVNDNDRLIRSRKQRNNIDQAMEKLRTEMVSLMDQDLSLMKQLLTLNETIEELKWQRQYYSCSTSCASLSVSRNMDSNWSVSDTEMYDSDDDIRATNVTSTSAHTGHVTGPTWHSTRKVRKTPRDFDTISLDSLKIKVQNMDISSSSSSSTSSTAKHDSSGTGSSSSTGIAAPNGNYVSKDSSDLRSSSLHAPSEHLMMSSETMFVLHDREQNSFDSGIHEVISGDDELIWNV